MRRGHVNHKSLHVAQNPAPKKLIFVSGAHKDMLSMPETVKDQFGYGLWLIQNGETPANASPFEGSQGTNIMKLIERHNGETYRCVYAAKFEHAVFVLHVFQKKSNTGIATSQAEIDLVRTRFLAAQDQYHSSHQAEEK